MVMAQLTLANSPSILRVVIATSNFSGNKEQAHHVYLLQKLPAVSSGHPSHIAAPEVLYNPADQMVRVHGSGKYRGSCKPLLRLFLDS